MGRYGLEKNMDCTASNEQCPLALDEQIDQIQRQLDAAVDARSKLDFEMAELKNATSELRAVSAKLISLIHELTGHF